jgi:hypothetical protein
MNPKLERVKVKTGSTRNDYLTIQDTGVRQLRVQGLQQFRKVAIERFTVPTLNQDLVAISEDDSSETIPLRLKDPTATGWYIGHSFRKHG